MNFLKTSFAIASTLLIVSCNSGPVRSSQGNLGNEEHFADCITADAFEENSTSQSSAQEQSPQQPDSDDEPIRPTEKDPGCILPEVN